MKKRVTPPRGKSLFEEGPAAAPTRRAAHIANIDGAARGNPGPASYGVMVRDASGKVVATLKKYIGRATNNVAEYYGLIAALDYAQSHGIRALRIESDSELLVKQMRGLYKVKSGDLRPLFERAKKMSQALEAFAIEHVFRERNREADRLANEALDTPEPPRGERAPSSSAPKMPTHGLEPRRLRARYQSGILYPLEEVELPDGTVLEISLHLPPKPTL